MDSRTCVCYSSFTLAVAGWLNHVVEVFFPAHHQLALCSGQSVHMPQQKFYSLSSLVAQLSTEHNPFKWIGPCCNFLATTPNEHSCGSAAFRGKTGSKRLYISSSPPVKRLIRVQISFQRSVSPHCPPNVICSCRVWAVISEWCLHLQASFIYLFFFSRRFPAP